MTNKASELSRLQELTDVALLRPHPRNYRSHPDDQLQHIIKSITEHGFYRNIVVAKDNTILAGHGVVQAAVKMGIAQVPVIRLPIDPNEPLALKVLTSDNEISRLGEVNDRLLTDLLKEILTTDDLMGTGFDEQQLSALLMVTRLPDALLPKNEHEEWHGMPGYEPGDPGERLIVQFRTVADREQFVKVHAIVVTKQGANSWSAWWPPQGQDGEVVKWAGVAS